MNSKCFLNPNLWDNPCSDDPDDHFDDHCDDDPVGDPHDDSVGDSDGDPDGDYDVDLDPNDPLHFDFVNHCHSTPKLVVTPYIYAETAPTFQGESGRQTKGKLDRIHTKTHWKQVKEKRDRV